MKRTTITPPDDLAVAVEREARRRHVSVSEIARRALGEHLGLADGRPRRLRFVGIARSRHQNSRSRRGGDPRPGVGRRHCEALRLLPG